jgi:hypothetical protein
MALLRRKRTMERLREAYGSLPAGLAKRLGDEADRLFDELYKDVRANTMQYRLTEKGVRVAKGEPENIASIDDETLVATLARAVRNSSHGLLDMLDGGSDRFLLAINTGDIPAEFSALAPLVGLGLLADPSGLIDGTWRTKLNAA